MNSPGLNLASPPIVEAVVDIDCDMPPAFDLIALKEVLRKAFQDKYPKLQLRSKFFGGPLIPGAGEPPRPRGGIESLHWLQEDQKQLVQIRARGFSFNRLAPYTSLDDYLPEIERAWKIFVGIAAPVEVRAVRLRYINRIFLPLVEGRVKLDDYFRVSPKLSDEDNLELTHFLDQHTAVEKTTGHQVNTVLASQMPEKLPYHLSPGLAGLASQRRPIIFDIGVASEGREAPENWAWIVENIQSLRGLKNRIFMDTLTERCLGLFQG